MPEVCLGAIGRVLAVVEAETDDHFTSHVVFVRKVLRESWADAFAIAAGFRHVRLTREKCLKVAVGWYDDEDPRQERRDDG
jgi:hypothetical protein